MNSKSRRKSLLKGGKQMLKRKKRTRALYTIGNEYFEFNSNYEQKIYDYLCCNGSNKKLKKLKKCLGENAFTRYCDWENYVRNKYNNYDDVMLNEFSRHLNQRIRNNEPGKKIDTIMAEVSLPFILTAITTSFISIKVDNTIGLPIIFITIFLMISTIVFGMGIIITKIYDSLSNIIKQQYFLTDYKKIIDNMLSERKKPSVTP